MTRRKWKARLRKFAAFLRQSSIVAMLRKCDLAASEFDAFMVQWEHDQRELAALRRGDAVKELKSLKARMHADSERSEDLEPSFGNWGNG